MWFDFGGGRGDVVGVGFRVIQEVEFREYKELGEGVRDDVQVWGLSSWCMYISGGVGFWVYLGIF